MKARDEAEDLRLDWALAERRGGETPPDLAARIAARIRNGEGAELSAITTRREAPQTARWLAAALILLGLGVVLAVALRPRHANDAERDAAPVQEQEAPPASRVFSLQEIIALPLDTRRVEAQDVDDGMLTALTRLRNLESLELRTPACEGYGMGLKVERTEAPASITRAGFGEFAKFSKLRRLVLSGTYKLAWRGPEASMPLFAELEKLPLLSELTLRCFDTEDGDLASLAKLPNLRRLDLSFNHGFSEAGIAAILQCQQLRALSLKGCQQLHGSLLAKLGELPHLEELDVGEIDGINWRTDPSEVPMEPHVAQALEAARQMARRPGTGVTDEAVRGIARATQLRKLDLTNGHYTNAGLAALAPLEHLEALEMFGMNGPTDDCVVNLPQSLTTLGVCGDYTDEFCKRVRTQLPHLAHLDVSACYQIHDAGAAELLRIPTLRNLEIRQMYGMTAASIPSFLRAVQLEELDLRICEFVKTQHVLALRQALPKLRKLQTSVDEGELQKLEQQQAQQPVLILQRGDVAKAAPDTRSAQVLYLDAAGFAEFVQRLRELEGLNLATSEGNQSRLGVWYTGIELHPSWSIDDSCLEQVAKLTKLRHLDLCGNHQITGVGIAQLEKLPLLTELDLSCTNLDDTAIEHLRKVSGLRSLTLVQDYGFGKKGVEAIASCLGLRSLSLRECTYLHGDWLEKLAALTSLEHLDLGGIDGQHVARVWSAEQAQMLLLSAPDNAKGPDTGLTDAAVLALRPLVHLQSLSLMSGKFSQAALEVLTAFPQLQVLDLSANGSLNDDIFALLPIGLRELRVNGCFGLGDRFYRQLAERCPHLERVFANESQLMTDNGAAALARLPELKRLDLFQCPKLTAKTIDALQQSSTLEEVDLRGMAWVTPDHVAALKSLPHMHQVLTDSK